MFEFAAELGVVVHVVVFEFAAKLSGVGIIGTHKRRRRRY